MNINSIVYLPPIDSIDPKEFTCTRCHVAHPLESRGFEHPAVILEVGPNSGRETTARFLCITSFQDVDLENYVADRNSRPSYRSSLPILHPADIHLKALLDYSVLTLANGKVMKKQSYVKIDCLYKTKLSLLNPYYHTFDKKLDVESSKLLRLHFSIEPATTPDISTAYRPELSVLEAHQPRLVFPVARNSNMHTPRSLEGQRRSLISNSLQAVQHNRSTFPNYNTINGQSPRVPVPPPKRTPSILSRFLSHATESTYKVLAYVARFLWKNAGNIIAWAGYCERTLGWEGGGGDLG
ncbi:hypothetical protein G7Y89_g14551 [Cudoniella acicularis]|uniref:Uncharacterized protein n=1 Tax=Cudoniella acicularis TaxID=354080 RepID=A0A8H4VTF7_9HELO|nr:hypothetical protein G7Y89_g14551 [Cudoniella acicularis]